MLDPKVVKEKYAQFVEHFPKYKDKLEIDPLQFEVYRAYQDWMPTGDRVEVLFIAESPSQNRCTYFYSRCCEAGLSKYIPDFLGITRGTKTQKLEEFKRRGYFLIDTISCIYKTKQKEKIPTELIKFSAEKILKPEIEELKPNTIVVIGKTALNGLKSIEQFKPALKGIKSVTELKLEQRAISAGDTNLIISIYPGRQTQRHHKDIRATFKLINTEKNRSAN